MSDWTRKEFDERRAELMAWINQRWKTESGQDAVILEVVDEDDDDSIEYNRKE